MSIERNNTSEVTEQQRAMREAMANALNSGLSSRVGAPVSSLKSPGTVVDVEKATVAISAATKEHDSEVFFSHSPPLLTRSL